EDQARLSSTKPWKFPRGGLPWGAAAGLGARPVCRRRARSSPSYGPRCLRFCSSDPNTRQVPNAFRVRALCEGPGTEGPHNAAAEAKRLPPLQSGVCGDNAGRGRSPNSEDRPVWPTPTVGGGQPLQSRRGRAPGASPTPPPPASARNALRLRAGGRGRGHVARPEPPRPSAAAPPRPAPFPAGRSEPPRTTPGGRGSCTPWVYVVNDSCREENGRMMASFQRSNSHDKVRRIVAEEGRTARNLIAWSVPLESKEDDGNPKCQTGGKSKRSIQGTHKATKQVQHIQLSTSDFSS
uniref:S-phase cyclin A associated protein in the ER n=1 Tax=Oryctolagus cuniculus TaxID=9986 RepID=A0A5F9CAB2_RABIT